MTYTVQGKITEVGSIIPTTGKTREKLTFMIRDDDDNGREIAFLVFDENIHTLIEPLEIGDKVKVSFTIKTRKYTDKNFNVSYITSCFAINIEKIESKQQRTGRDWYRQREEQQQKQWHTYDRPPWESSEEDVAGKFKDQYSKTSFINYFMGCRNAQEAKKRYRELSKKHHPDMPGGNTQIFQTISTQYEKWK